MNVETQSELVEPASNRLREIGAAAVVLVLSLLLIDAAVETFASKSPARWWITGIVAAYGGAVGLIVWGGALPRIGWRRMASGALFTLLGAITVATWTPGGLTHGMVMLRRPTSVVLSAVSASAVALAGFVIIRLRMLPGWARLAAGFVAAYGACAFALAGLETTPYQSLFNRGSLWQRLPSPLQGAFLGALVLVPVALVISLFAMVVPSLRKTCRTGGFQGLALFLCFAVSVQGFCAPDAIPTQPGGVESADSQDPVGPDRRTAGVQQANASSLRVQQARSGSAALEAFYASLDEIDRVIEKSAIDVDALTARLRGDPDEILQFVSTSIRYEHYDGVLRGALGTLAARAGNSCDQGLLVQRLLKAANIQSSLAAVKSDPGLSRQLLERALRDAARRQPLSNDWAGGAYAGKVNAQLHDIVSVMPGLAATFSSATPNTASVSYCWVEADLAGGTRVFDAPGLMPQSGGAGSRKFNQDSSVAAHTLHVRVLLDRSRAGMKEEAILSVSFPSSVLELDPITLSIVPSNRKFWDKVQGGADPRVALDEVDGFYPMVTFRGSTSVERGFAMSGDILVPTLSQLQGVAEAGKRVEDLLGGGRIATATGREPEQTPTSAFRPATPFAVRVEYQLDAPDGESEIHRRSLIEPEVVEHSARRGDIALRLIQQRQILVSTFAASDDYLAAKFIAEYRRYKENLAGLVNRVPKEDISPTVPTGDILPYPTHLLSIAQRQDAVALALGLGRNAVLSRSRPGVLVSTERFDVKSDRVERLTSVDVVTTGFDAVGPSGRDRILMAKMGLYSTFIEADLAEGGWPETLAAISGQAKRAGTPLIGIEPGDDGRLSALSIEPPQRDALARDLRRGRGVAAFAKPVSFAGRTFYGWWSIDLTSGEVLGVLESGEGGSVVDRMTLTSTVVIGAVLGTAVGYLYCTLAQGRTVSQCHRYGVCGALFGALGGALSWYLSSATLLGAVLGSGAALAKKVCEGGWPGNYDRTDNDGDGIPNGEDPNDDNDDLPDDVDPDDDNDNWPDCTSGDAPDACDAFPGDRENHRDTDHDGIGDNDEDDADDDGIPDCGRSAGYCDAWPDDPGVFSDRDHDGIDDRGDDHVDSDGDGIDDEQDACHACMLPKQNDFDGDGDPNLHDPAPRDPNIHRPSGWNRNEAYPKGPRVIWRARSSNGR